jgi:hypothetical protein
MTWEMRSCFDDHSDLAFQNIESTMTNTNRGAVSYKFGKDFVPQQSMIVEHCHNVGDEDDDLWLVSVTVPSVAPHTVCHIPTVAWPW